MNNILRKVNKMCLPAQLYLGISLLTTLALIMQNVGLGNRYCVGHLQSNIPCNNMIVFAVKILYILG